MWNRTIKEFVGVIHNVLASAKHVTVPVDFVVVHLEKDDEETIIFESPFVVTGKALLSVQGKKFNLVINGEKLKFDVAQAMKQSLEKKVISRIDTIVGD